MADNAAIDNNYTRSLLGVSSVDGVSTVKVYADPTTHRLLVDFAGGVFISNSLALEIPTGTVNGINTVFTVQNNPLFEEVSGQVMVSQTQDGTNYGYTISGTGPYTITFSNAPTQTPHSFYASTSSGSLSSFFQTDTFTSTNGQKVFTASIAPTFVFSFVVNDGVNTKTLDYTQSGSTFTLNSGIPAGLTVTLTYAHA